LRPPLLALRSAGNSLSAALSGTCGSQHSGGTRDTATQHLTSLGERFRVRLRQLLPAQPRWLTGPTQPLALAKTAATTFWHLVGFSNHTAILQGLAVQKGTARSLSPGVLAPCG
jgi:hypothetical protein